jgi:hypothetical protein
MKKYLASTGLAGYVTNTGTADVGTMILLNNGQRSAGLGGANNINTAANVKTVTVHPTTTVHVHATSAAKPKQRYRKRSMMRGTTYQEE